MVAQLLFLCKRGRPDPQTASAFLTTRVNKTDNDDRKKIICVINYLGITIELILTMEAEETVTIKWWVNAEFSVHHNIHSHTGGCMTLRKGAIYSSSTKQKLNGKVNR